ncbi:hypothetical protein PN36_14590 [Candidatus Thiomargarita nelsonii]|uniref:Nucleotidyltransferase n=1 Tax=Candidatus Thiomargarita nelsonii TaxID=1003181 RepID=A0A0A6PFI3_9GAMM|nr:hypothetical protein PN36_14590 [Candidatus Thiomargarita nelsonii]
MPRTINKGFTNFLSKLTPTSVESKTAKNHRASIKACLKSNFNFREFFRSGSFGNGTSISGHSDVDYFVCIPNFSPNSRTFLLTQVRNALDGRFPRTRVRVSCPAVKVPFGTEAKESTEVVPALIDTSKSGYRTYNIPDCYGGWMRSSPDAHNEYVRKIDNKLNGKVKPLVRFIKAWKYYRQVPISSFYLELRVARYAEQKSSIVYDKDIKRIFNFLSDNQLAKMQDPMGISGYIHPCSTPAKLKEAKSKLATALSRATKAVAARENDVKNAFDWWKLLYNNNFPSYYK